MPGGRNTTWPSRKCGAASSAIAGCAKAGAGHRMRSAASMRFRDRRRDHGQPDITSPRPIDDRYRAALRTMRLDVSRISTPQPDFVTGQGEIAGGRERTVPSTQHCNLQDVLRFVVGQPGAMCSDRCTPRGASPGARRNTCYAGFALTFSCHAAQVGRSIWNKSVERAYQPLPCMRAIRRSACVSM